MRHTGRLATVLCAGLVLASLPLRPAIALEIILHQVPPEHTEHPASDPDLSQLTAIMQAAASYWQGLILDSHTREIWYGYQNLDIHGGIALIQAHDGLRPTEGAIALDSGTNWYFDPQPWNNDGYAMEQVLVRDLTPQQQINYYSGSPPALLEAGYWGIGPGPDAFTVALHEFGHVLGVTPHLPGSQAMLASGTYAFHPDFVNGATTGANIFTDPFDPSDTDAWHLNFPGMLMYPTIAGNRRKLPSATDVFAAASVAAWTTIDLYRKDFLGGAVWDLPQNWLGNRLPKGTDEVHVRHGGTLSVLLGGTAGALTIRDGGGVTPRPLAMDRSLTDRRRGSRLACPPRAANVFRSANISSCWVCRRERKIALTGRTPPYK